ncbi:hypothetical protein EYZ11_011047 [Aspergillus tanneri]|uniref:Gfo/Idh/MocA-like oxidoreductase N-terminal domain-containing protein n=1 Tax=Aspergillus tanneri TaxID=1220188 RepID=A0A4S3J3T6_9EURO|nr:uncharacterized protein ATNIH1004_009412 [Aspergillus tanneri]KAA8645195.1 hypothetical protein ATNIH1004_009412 [Aspergillus tanneri]THC89513.1 hypothetical protein EYZ11_011047 [Aspergillus tanneri]
MTQTIPGIALIGAGIYAREEHLPKLIAHNANLLAVYSRSQKSAESIVEAAKPLTKKAASIKAYSDESQDNLDALLGRADVTAVVIAVPILALPDLIRKCLAARKHVLSEKPVAKDFKTAAALISEYEMVYKPKGQLWSVGEQFRYDLGLRKARELIQSGAIGDLTIVNARVWAAIKPGNKYYETMWRQVPEYQGGFILDGGIHFVSVLSFVACQEITETRGFSKQIAPHLPPLDTVNAALQYNKGAQGCVSISLASTKTAFDFVFIGTEGTLTLQFMGKFAVKLDGKQQFEETIDGEAMSTEIKTYLDALSSGSSEGLLSAREALHDLAVVESLCSGGGVVQTL